MRARIFALALIPVLGFFANGVTYMSSERSVGAAFDSVKSSKALADASREFQSALKVMRLDATEFAARPSRELIQEFRAAQDVATKSLETIEEQTDGEAAKELPLLKTELRTLKETFATMVQRQEKLGFSDNEGLRGRLQQAATAVERILNDDIPWMSERDKNSLFVSLLVMRRYEAELRTSRASYLEQMFKQEYERFDKTLAGVIAAPIMKEDLSSQVKLYTDRFAEWLESTQEIHPSLAVIQMQTREMLPVADRIIDIGRAPRGGSDRHVDGLADADPQYHRRHGRGRRGFGLGSQSPDRPQHHGAADRARQGDGKAGARRYFGLDSGDHRARRDRSHGTHGHRLPRQCS